MKVIKDKLKIISLILFCLIIFFILSNLFGKSYDCEDLIAIEVIEIYCLEHDSEQECGTTPVNSSSCDAYCPGESARWYCDGRIPKT